MNQQTLLEYLKLNCQGRSNAATGKQLQTLFQCKDIREIQNTIKRLRKDGYPVSFANNKKHKGYYYPTTVEETKECRRQMLHQAIHSFETIRNFDAAVENEFGVKTQLEFEFKKSA
jgi:biotin operon repressor